MYRKVLLIICFSIFILFLSSCNYQKDKKIISIIGENTSTIQAMMTLESEFEKKFPNVDLQFHPNTFNDAFDKINQDFSNGTGQYDIVMQYNFSLSSFVRNNYVYNLNELLEMVENENLNFENDIFEKTWETVGHYYKDYKNPSAGFIKVGYPYVANSILLMYNKEMFENEENKKKFKQLYDKELSVPQTWEEYFNIAQFFTDTEKGTFGVCLEGASGDFLYFEIVNYLHSMGGRVLDKKLGWEGDENTSVVLNSPESLKAFEYIKSLKPFTVGNFTNVEQFQEMKLMKEGKTAMALSWEDIISLNIQTDSTFDSRFGFAPIPGNKSVIGGGAFFVNRNSENPKEAFQFILYLMQPETQIKLAKAGLSSPLKSVYEHPDVHKIPHMLALEKSLSRGGIYLEAGPTSSKVSEILSTYVQAMWSDKMSPEEALNKAHKEIKIEREKVYSNIN